MLVQADTIAKVMLAPAIAADNISTLLGRLAIAVLIGVLIGLERESHSKNEYLYAGVRTFPLISMMGFFAAYISSFVSPWVFICALMGFIVFVISSYIITALKGEYGITSEIAGILVFIFGSLVFWNHIQITVAATVILLLFLSLQPQLSSFAKNIKEEDITAALKFAIISLIILPVLPNETFGPLNVLNPKQIWYMVILIAGISFVGYILMKFIGSDKAIPITGILGGLVSSTAVTLSFSPKSKENKDLSRHFATAIILASTILFPRVLIEVFVVNQILFTEIVVPISILIALSLLCSIFLWIRLNKQASQSIEFSNPFELRSAIKFGLVFALILFISKAAQTYLGTNGIYIASVLGGLTDVDAITLSMSNLAKSSISNEVATNSILMAILSNTLVKFGIAFSLGSNQLRKLTLPIYALIFVTGIILIIL